MKISTTTLLFIWFVLWYALPLSAQERSVAGIVVTSRDRTPLEGVTVWVKGTARGVRTSPDGSFRIPVHKDSSLVFSFLGYDPQEIVPGNRRTIEVTLAATSRALGAVQIVGSRSANRTKLNAPVPVDIIDIRSLQEYAPQTSITQLLQYVSPSFHSINGSNAGDAGSALNLVQLKGLGVDQLLVLVNGKRRHKSANINWGGLGNGATGYDLNALPVAAVERIEILRDGAAAQYGSDAIAGVINIVLKQQVGVLQVNTTGSVRRRGDGLQTRSSANYGIKLGDNGGYVNVSAEFATQALALPAGRKDAGLYYGPIYGGGANTRDYDAIYTREIDDAILRSRGIDRHHFDQRGGGSNEAKDALLFFNAGVPLKEGAELYAFGGISHRNSEFTAVYRLPGWTERNNSFLYPDGFLPAMENIITDKSLAVGIKGKVKHWLVDFSNVYGRNDFGNVITNSLNASMGLKSPTSFDAGSYNASQYTASLDFSRYFDKALKGVNIAFGAQYRVESYKIKAGEAASYLKADLRQIYKIDTSAAGVPYLADAGWLGLNGLSPGSQIHAGFRPENEVQVSRAITAGYLDIEANITKDWLLSAAVRAEHFSDFGNVTTGKIATRYSLARWLSVRGAFNTGFRAPDLAQFYYTETSTSFQQGRAVDQVTASNKSAATRALGIPALTPERSRGYTAGITSQPAANVELTLDAYEVAIDNRVGNTGNFSATDRNLPPEVRNLLLQTGTTQAKFFYNAFSSRTRGVEITGSYKLPLYKGSLTFLAGANFVKNEVTSVNTPKGLEAYRYTIFNDGERARVTTHIPGQKITVQGVYAGKRFNALVRAVYFGGVTTATAQNANFPRADYFLQRLRPIWVADVALGYRITPAIQVTLGINNLLNEVGDYTAAQISGLRTPTVVGLQNGSAGIQPFARLSARF